MKKKRSQSLGRWINPLSFMAAQSFPIFIIYCILSRTRFFCILSVTRLCCISSRTIRVVASYLDRCIYLDHYILFGTRFCCILSRTIQIVASYPYKRQGYVKARCWERVNLGASTLALHWHLPTLTLRRLVVKPLSQLSREDFQIWSCL